MLMLIIEILHSSTVVLSELYNEATLFLLNPRRFDDFEHIVYYVLHVKIIHTNSDISVIIV